MYVQLFKNKNMYICMYVCICKMLYICIYICIYLYLKTIRIDQQQEVRAEKSRNRNKVIKESKGFREIVSKLQKKVKNCEQIKCSKQD